MKGDKLDCNYENRLGMGKGELADYIGILEEEEEEIEEEEE